MGRRAWIIVVPGLLALVSCREDSPSNGTAGGTTSTSSRASVVTLADRLADNGDTGLFDHRYVADLGDDGVLFVGVEDDAAVAYVCDPTVGSTWLAGTVQDGEVDLSAPSGATLAGTIDGETLVATLAGAPSNDGEITLAEDPAARLQRPADGANGEVVSGLVEHGGTVRGTLDATSVGLTPLAGATVGVIVSLVRGQITVTFAVPAALVTTIRSALSAWTTRMLEIRASPRTIDEENIEIQQEIEAAKAKIEAERDAAIAQFVIAVVAAIVTVAAGGATLGASGAVAQGVPIPVSAALSVRDAVVRLVASQTTSSTTTTTSPSKPISVPTMTVVALAS